MLGQLFTAVSVGFCACSFCLIFASSCVVNCVCVPACECGHMHLCTVCGCHRTTQVLADIFHLFGAASVCAAPARALPWAFLGFSWLPPSYLGRALIIDLLLHLAFIQFWRSKFTFSQFPGKGFSHIKPSSHIPVLYHILTCPGWT